MSHQGSKKMDSSGIGFCGIIRSSFHIIFSEKKLMSAIALLFILPISLLSIVQYIALLILCNSIAHNTGSEHLLYRVVLIIFVCLIFEIAFSLLSWAAVVYTAACSYTEKPITFHTVRRSLNQIWKRLAVTCLWCSLIAIIYSAVSGIVLGLLGAIDMGHRKLIVCIIMFILYLIGLIYLNIVFGMAFAISVLEDVYGRASIVRSKNLLRGKELVAGALYILVAICAVVIQAIFAIFTILGSINLGLVILQVVVLFVVSIMVVLLIEVIQTMPYFECKFHHGETIDETVLSSLIGT